MSNPRVSVICIFFEAERYFAEAIESVLAQDFRNFELLLVDDGSTDASSEMADELARQHPDRIRVLEHPGKVNRGMSATRNLGLRHASGEYVAFIDADDRWRSSKLREQVALLDAHPEVDAVCGAVNYWASHDGGQDELIRTGHVQNRAIAPPEALLRFYPLGEADPPCPSDLMLRRSIIDAVSGFEESFTGPLQMYEDQAFLTKFYLKGTIVCSDKVWLDYRLHDEACTATVIRNGQRHQVRRHCLEWFERYLDGTPYRRNPAIRWALFRALRPYRHPHVTNVGRMLKNFARRLTRREVAA